MKWLRKGESKMKKILSVAVLVMAAVMLLTFTSSSYIYAADAVDISFSTDLSVSDALIFTDGTSPAIPTAPYAFGGKLGYAGTAAGYVIVFQEYPLGADMENLYQTVDGSANDYKLAFELYIPDASVINFEKSFTKLVIGPLESDPAGGAWTMGLSGLADGWNLVEMPLSSEYYNGALDVDSLTSLDLSAFNVTVFNSEETFVAVANAKLYPVDAAVPFDLPAVTEAVTEAITEGVTEEATEAASEGPYEQGTETIVEETVEESANEELSGFAFYAVIFAILAVVCVATLIFIFKRKKER